MKKKVKFKMRISNPDDYKKGSFISCNWSPDFQAWFRIVKIENHILTVRELGFFDTFLLWYS